MCVTSSGAEDFTLATADITAKEDWTVGRLGGAIKGQVRCDHSTVKPRFLQRQKAAGGLILCSNSYLKECFFPKLLNHFFDNFLEFFLLKTALYGDFENGLVGKMEDFFNV